MAPKLSHEADESCNRSITLMAWSLGHLNICWELS